MSEADEMKKWLDVLREPNAEKARRMYFDLLRNERPREPQPILVSQSNWDDLQAAVAGNRNRKPAG